MRIILTGSSSGIGRALALRLLERGHHVWGLARTDQSALVSVHPGTFAASRCDVRDWPQVEEAFREVAAVWPSADALITCAGTQGEIGTAVAADPVNWSATVRTNLDGTYYAIRAAHPLLSRSSRRAKIVCLSGGGATKARPRFSAYGVAKAAVVRLVETIAEEQRTAPLDINAVAPGAINTGLTDEVIRLGPDVVGADEYASAVKLQATGGGSLDRALDLVEWLLSSASDGISGRLISAPWDPWPTLDRHATELAASDIYMLRRIVPEERGRAWGLPEPGK